MKLFNLAQIINLLYLLIEGYGRNTQPLKVFAVIIARDYITILSKANPMNILS